MVYTNPTIEITELDAEDIILASGETGGEVGGGGGNYEGEGFPLSLRKGGTIAGGSTVSNVANNSSASNAFSAGDIFGLR